MSKLEMIKSSGEIRVIRVPSQSNFTRRILISPAINTKRKSQLSKNFEIIDSQAKKIKND